MKLNLFLKNNSNSKDYKNKKRLDIKESNNYSLARRYNNSNDIYENYPQTSRYEYYDDDNPKRKPKKTSLFRTLMSAFGITLLVGTSVALSVYFLTANRNNNFPEQANPNTDIPANNINPHYQNNIDPDSVSAMKYIFERSVSMQFVFSGKGREARSISGTGWIFNKDASSDRYYLATNLHVAAALTYSGKEFVDNGISYDFTNLTHRATYLGFISDTTGSQISNVHRTDDLNMLKVKNPKIVYTATANNDTNGFGKSFAGLHYKRQTITQKPFESDASLDFSILEFDFSDNALNQEAKSDFANKENVSIFKTWLQNYNNNPTKYYTKPVTGVIENDFYQTKLHMGGFPSTNNTSNFAGSTANGISLNFGGTSWQGFSSFTLAVQNEDIQSNSNINVSNYDSYAKSGYINYKNAIDSNNYEFISDVSGVQFFNNGNDYPTNYVNVGYSALLDATSLGGSSGSMMVLKDNGEFKVVGIYWGNIIFGDSDINPATNVGIGNFLYVKNKSIQKGVQDFNTYQYAMDKIKNNLGVEFKYNPRF